MSEAGTLVKASHPTVFDDSPAIRFRLPRSTWIVIGLVTVIAAVVGGAIAAAMPEKYQVTRSVLVMSGNNPNDNDTLIRSLESIIGAKHFATTLKERSGLDLTVDEISGMISTNRPVLSAVIEVSATDASLATATAVSEQISPTLQDIFENGQRSLPVEARISGPIVTEMSADPVREQVFVPWWTGVFTGGLLAFLVALAVAAFRQFRRPVITSARDLSDALDVPVLARVRAVGVDPDGSPSDAVLGMLSAIELLGADGPIHRLVVVGPSEDEERSRLVLALGCAIARDFDQPVALVDANLASGGLSRLVGKDGERGLAECLNGAVEAQAAMVDTTGSLPDPLRGLRPAAGSLSLLPAGVDRDAGLVRMRSSLTEVLSDLSGRYVVVIDGPDVPGPVPSAQLLSLADATLVVVTEGETSIRDARYTGDAMRALAGESVGAVLVQR
ncbi:MAG: hypothetical protein IPG46_03160 [Actinobacteria bacterium]|nr:hypothetical protein [Actinomycetota bacterium]